MSRLRNVAFVAIGALITTLAPSAAGATGVARGYSSTSEVDFGDCTELATGSVVELSELRDRVPDEVQVLSLTEQGTVFPGSDNLGVLITRVLDCDSITVTRNGRGKTQHNRHVAHVGTAIDTSNLPATPFSLDGGNDADFSNYIFGYYSDSQPFLKAMRRAGVQSIGRARIDMVDKTVEECVVDRTVTVRPRTRPRNNYGFTATGVIPLAACEPSVVPFIGNWWSVKHGKASVLSNKIAGQSAIFLSPEDATITLTATRRSQLADLLGARSAEVDAFGFSGFIPENPDSAEIITKAGRVG